VKSTGWIGVVHLESASIRVLPQLIDGHRNLIRLLDYVGRLDLMKRLPLAASFQADSDDLFDLIALLLAEACDDVVRAGVHADYIPDRDELRVLRGRLDVKAQVLQRWGRVDRLICEYDDRSRQILENRWLLRAIRLARRGVRATKQAGVVKRAAAVWEDLCEDDRTDHLEPVLITRTNRHYKRALELAYLVVAGTTVNDVLRSGRVGGFSFLLSMPRLFEQFISSAIAQLLRETEIQVEPQAISRFVLWDAINNQPFASVRPDLLLTDPVTEWRLPVDAKYKRIDSGGLGHDDVYQAAVYGLTLAGSGQNRCLLMYPASSSASRAHEVHVRVGGSTATVVQALGVSVADWLDELSSGRLGPESTAVMEALEVGRSTARIVRRVEVA
jgi:5-methylcytosine-specific restriction enzyme subunit McrC